MFDNNSIECEATSLADYSVCMEADGGLVYLAEFRTYAEAVQIAEQAFLRTETRIAVRHEGVEVRTFETEVNLTNH